MRWSSVIFFFVLLGATHAQTGVRLLLWDYALATEGGIRGSQTVGFGLDHDVSERGSIGLDLKMGIGEGGGWGAYYRSAYHVSDNENASFYLGPTLGFARIGEDDPVTVVPLGFRMGVRGGLEGFYADLYGGVISNLGAGSAVSTGDGEVTDTSGLLLVLGLNIGFGWAGSGR